MRCAQSRLGQALALVLCVLVLAVSVQVARPTPAHALDPVTITVGFGIALSAAAVAAIVALAMTYPEGLTFQQNAQKCGATVQELFIVQSMIDVAFGAGIVPASSWFVVRRDGRLARACAVWMQKIPGAWAKIQNAANTATTEGANTSVNVGDSWGDLGFADTPAGTISEEYPQGFADAGGFMSGGENDAYALAAAAGAGFPGTVDYPLSYGYILTPPGTDEDELITIIEEICTDGGSIIKYNNGITTSRTGPTGSETAFNFSPGVSVATDNQFKCMYCGETKPFTAAAVSLQFGRAWQIENIGGTITGHWEHQNTIAAGGSASVNGWLLHHGSFQCYTPEADTADLETRLDNLSAAPTYITYNTTTYEELTNGGSTSIPDDVPATVPTSTALENWWTGARSWWQTKVGEITNAISTVTSAVSSMSTAISTALSASAITTVPSWAQTTWNTITAPVVDAIAGLGDVLWPFRALSEAGGGAS